MIFHEIYSAYYNAVARIIDAILKNDANDKDLQRIVVENAFNESVLTILPALKNEKWQLLHSDMTTPIEHSPTQPLTLLEKRWLKAIALDPRAKLFGISDNGLSDVEPLFTPEDYRIYDKYSDGDPYTDREYIERFKLILYAVKTRSPINIEMLNKSGRVVFARCIPTRLEYSEKDDKFRVLVSGCRYASVINLARIVKCGLYKGEHVIKDTPAKRREDTVLLEIKNERNALERVMLHFAHFEKQAEALGRGRYRLRICYDHSDEAEMVIRILSFGPRVKVIEPESFVDLVKEKLKKQQSCGLK